MAWQMTCPLSLRRLKLSLLASVILTHSNIPTDFVREVSCIFISFLMDRVVEELAKAANVNYTLTL